MAFAHLHVHTNYSTFDGMARIEDLFRKAEELNIDGLAITDHGFMYGIPEFFRTARKYDSIKPVVGCEIYLTDHYDHRIKDPEHYKCFHLILLAQNIVGYRNLCKIVTIGAIEGMYKNKPRVSHEIIEKFHDGLIALSGCIGGEIPQAILAGDTIRAKKAIKWYLEVFGDNFFLEVSLHHSKKHHYKGNVFELQEKANKSLFELGKKYGINVVATNDVHITDYKDSLLHEALLCANTGKAIDDKDRFIYTGEEYLKSAEAMMDVFAGHQEVIHNTLDVLAKIERFDIKMPVQMPTFKFPDTFNTADDYLRHLSYKGLENRAAKTKIKKFGARGEKERINYELEIIANKSFSNYFLILWDIVRAVKENGHSVGPGRGAAPASFINYLLGITDIDPIETGLPFESFIALDRESLPDIDLDFDKGGYKDAYNYLKTKYSHEHVSRVISFERRGLNSGSLEGTITGSGLHSCAVLLSEKPLVEYLPLQIIHNEYTGEDDIASQYYDIRDIGPLKLNFYVLHELDMIRETSQGLDIPDTFDDPAVYDIFSKGETDGIFMFDSNDIKEWLRKLKPDCFNDLVALYILYLPKNLDFINDYIKHRNLSKILPKYNKTQAVTHTAIAYRMVWLRVHSS